MKINWHSQRLSTLAFLMLVCILFASQSAHSKVWNCTNKDMEIQCHGGKCEITDEFTPIYVSVNSIDGHMSVCAYSGCYTGTGVVTINKSHLLFSGLILTSADNSDGIMIAIDTDKKIAVINGMSFSMPLLC